MIIYSSFTNIITTKYLFLLHSTKLFFIQPKIKS